MTLETRHSIMNIALTLAAHLKLDIDTAVRQASLLVATFTNGQFTEEDITEIYISLDLAKEPVWLN